MLVSLFTDASVCGDTGAAGWGYWVKSERKRTYGGAPFDETFEIVSAAELAAAVMGLRRAVVERVALPGDDVLIQVDNLEAVRCIKGEPPRGSAASPAMLPWWHAMFETARENNLRVLGRHVKAHQEGDSRSFVNNLADDYAGRGMRAARLMTARGVVFG